MKMLILLGGLLLLSACSKPTDIVFGPEPLKQMVEQGERFKTLPEEDRKLLAGYVSVKGMAQATGSQEAKPITGRTVGEVLAEARAWQIAMIEKEAARKGKDAEAEALRAKVLAK